MKLIVNFPDRRHRSVLGANHGGRIRTVWREGRLHQHCQGVHGLDTGTEGLTGREENGGARGKAKDAFKE